MSRLSLSASKQHATNAKAAYSVNDQLPERYTHLHVVDTNIFSFGRETAV